MEKPFCIPFVCAVSLGISACASATATTDMLRSQTRENLGNYQSELGITRTLQRQRDSLESKLNSLRQQLTSLDSQPSSEAIIEQKIRIKQEIAELERQLVILNTDE